VPEGFSHGGAKLRKRSSATIRAGRTSREHPLATLEKDRQRERYEHAVLVTSLAERDVRALTQMYRDRTDAENMLRPQAESADEPALVPVQSGPQDAQPV
jgi:hypothetical protein